MLMDFLAVCFFIADLENDFGMVVTSLDFGMVGSFIMPPPPPAAKLVLGGGGELFFSFFPKLFFSFVPKLLLSPFMTFAMLMPAASIFRTELIPLLVALNDFGRLTTSGTFPGGDSSFFRLGSEGVPVQYLVSFRVRSPFMTLAILIPALAICCADPNPLLVALNDLGRLTTSGTLFNCFVLLSLDELSEAPLAMASNELRKLSASGLG
mmetsp:Transcript_23636/g.42476  ORF Transcript_23636/g.42476 Transcript_23636/m.42476 type:complete len:209 (-) Transcript_23636:1047-1673(-)